MNLILFILFAQSLQQCLVRQGLSTQYFVNQTETIRLDLLDYFIGQNLTYYSEYIKIYNTIYETSEFNTNTQIEGTAIFQSQFNKEWLNYLAQVGTLNTQILVNIFKLDQGQLALDYSIFLPIQEYQLVCEDLAFIDDSNVIVDCYYINNTVQYNQFYIVSKNYAIPMIIPNTNTSVDEAPQYREMEVAHAQNKQIYLFRAAYNMSNHTGLMQVFSIPEGQLIQTYDTIVMSDFQIINYDLYLLNLTQTIYVYSLNDLSSPSQTYNLTYDVPSFVYLLAMDVDVSETAIWVYTDQMKDNLIEISSKGIIKSHSIWIFDKSIEDYAQIQNNQKLVSLQIEDTIYFYAKRVQFDLISIVNQQLISLNQSPFTLLTYYNSYVFYSWITSPYAEAQFTDSTIAYVEAKSENVFGSALCQQSFNFTVIDEKHSSLNQKNANFPQSAIANRQSLYYDIHQFASGPLIDYQAYSNLTVIFSNPSIQYNESSYVWQKIRGLDSFYSQDFDTYAQLIIESKLKNGIFQQSVITLRLCDIQVKNRLFYVNNLDCTEYRGILSTSAPIDKVQFTDITQTDEVYAVLNIARAAVVIYRFTSFSTFSHIKSQFVCEPLAIDNEYRYQHGIDDFSVIGTNLYMVLTRINQIWVYYIPECKKISEINTVTLNSSEFLPQYIIGEANLETNSAVGQLLFIGTYTSVLMVEFMDNKVPILQNVIDFPYNATKSMVSVVNQTLIMALQDDKNFHLLSYSYDQNQPSIKPKFQKELPLYNRRPDNDFVVNSDQQFYYIQMNNGFYYVYDPLLDTNDCLVYELGNVGDFITPTYIPNKNKQSIVMLSSLVTLVTYSLTNPQIIEVTFYPNDDQVYMTGVDYSITFSSNISSNNFTVINTTQLYDTLIIGQTNLTAFYDQNLGTYQESTSSGQIQLYLSNVINNNIVGYSLSKSNYFELIKPFNSAYYTSNAMFSVDQMTSYPNNNSVFLQNTTGIYLYSNTTRKQIYNFNYVFSDCHLLEYQVDLLLSICSFYGTYYFSFFPNTDFYSPTIYTVKNIIYEPQKSLVFQNVIFTLAIHSLNTYYQIQLFNVVQGQMMYVLTLGCGNTGLEGDVGDFIVNKNDNSYIILYTCPFEQVVKYSILTQDGTNFQTETSQTLELNYGIILPKGAWFLELIQFDNYILLTTREFYSFLFSYTFISQNEYAINIQSWIAPMQDAVLTKNTKYYNETLYMEYKTNNSQTLLASYNLTAPLPHLICSQMVLTFESIKYALITPNKQLCIYQDEYPLLLLIMNSTNTLQVNYNNLDSNIWYATLLQINQRYGSNISLEFETGYYPSVSHLQWWGYILIIIFIAVLFTGIGVAIYQAQQKKKRESQPNNEYLVVSNHLELYSQEFEKK